MNMLTCFLDDAFNKQRGEFYPERHIANLENLAQEYPMYDSNVIDCLYRMAIHLSTYAEIVAQRVLQKELSKDEAVAEMKVTFFHFSPSVIELALDEYLES